MTEYLVLYWTYTTFGIVLDIYYSCMSTYAKENEKNTPADNSL